MPMPETGADLPALSTSVPPLKPQSDRRARQLDDALTQSDFRTSAEIGTISDPFQSAGLHLQSLKNHPHFRLGRVQLSLPYCNWYRVALDGLAGIVPCCRVANDATNGLIGVRDTSMLPPGCRVVVMVTGHKWGYIIGTAPAIVEHGNDVYPDFVVQGSGVGVRRDDYYQHYLKKLKDQGGVLDFSNSRPVDETIYDWGRMAESGVGLHIDPAMFFLRIDELCGLFGFYEDQFLRLAGQGLDVWTAAHTEEYRNDEGESTIYRGEAAYPWEALGAFDYGTNISRENDDAEVIHKLAESKFEPIEADLQPFHRWQEYGGYLGQGHIRQLSIPPKDTGSGFNRFSISDKPPIGVFREQISMEGGYALQSAKELIFAKRSLIPIPKRIRPSEDYSKEADRAENNNYRFSGKEGFGAGDPHSIGDIDKGTGTSGPEEFPNLMAAASLLDIHAYIFNWKGLHPFHYHKGDFKVAEEKDITPEGYTAYRPQFGELASKWWLPPPTPNEMHVDHRYNDGKPVKYYAVDSNISLLDDGSVVIRGGQGEEIRMLGGNITFSCPGSLLLQPGKSVVMMSGDDIILKAYNSVDITATNKDFRGKAECNMQFISGNGGTGGMLVENKATSTEQVYPQQGGESIKGSGIVLKAAHSQFVAMAGAIYLRTGDSPNIDPGNIVIDAGKGMADVIVTASTVKRFLGSGAVDSFGLPFVTSVNSYSAYDNLFSGSIESGGSLLVQQSARIAGGVVAVKGGFSNGAGGELGKIQDMNLELSALADMSQSQETATSNSRDDYKTKLQEPYYNPGKIGESQLQKQISGSLRTAKEYGTADNFYLPQTYWQAINVSVGAGQTWTENSVKYQEATEQQPWPGKEAWEDKDVFLAAPKSGTMYDYEKGMSKDRTDEAYIKRTIQKLEKKNLNKEYKIIPSES